MNCHQNIWISMSYLYLFSASSIGCILHSKKIVLSSPSAISLIKKRIDRWRYMLNKSQPVLDISLPWLLPPSLILGLLYPIYVDMRTDIMDHLVGEGPLFLYVSSCGYDPIGPVILHSRNVGGHPTTFFFKLTLLLRPSIWFFDVAQRLWCDHLLGLALTFPLHAVSELISKFQHYKLS